MNYSLLTRQLGRISFNMVAVATFVLVFLSLVTIGSAVNADCPAHLTKTDHLRQFGSSCYEFILDHPGDWHHAEADCVKKNGHLVDIHSFSEQAFVFNTMQILGFHDDKGVWIGLTDFDGEGNWHWTTNKALTFTNWASGQPGTVGGVEDCGLLEFKDTGLWHDYPCEGFLFFSQNHGWICEYPLA